MLVVSEKKGLEGNIFVREFCWAKILKRGSDAVSSDPFFSPSGSGSGAKIDKTVT